MASAKSERYVFTFGLFSGRCCNFFCLEALKQISLDLVALRIFSLYVEYTISSENKEIRTPGQNGFILKIVCRLFCKH